MRTVPLPAFASLAILAALLAAPSAGWSMGSSSFKAAPAGDLADARRLIDKYEFRGAIAKLKAIVAQEPNNADAWNYLGFSHRKLKEWEDAKTSYATALRIDPAHKGALEYQGELLIETGDTAEAERNLATLQGLCPAGCEERDALAAALARTRAGKSS